MGSYQRYADMYDSPSLFGISAFPQRLLHCVKSVQILSFFWSRFFRIQTEYGPEETPYLDTFHAVSIMRLLEISCLFQRWCINPLMPGGNKKVTHT